ncbi:hypothetical protein [Synechococcus sp. UW179A]|uniref:hypothetical protein n=1 Tax=Synechococcus sp. UW179A TaxID=2575510 RepID=UPI000E0F9E31|nr:hypothetical protein [Synechococcus sp. UW179A]
MTDSYSDSRHQGGQGDNGRDSGRGGRGGRGQGNREGGGFRIRLSDNEMRSARALQEAFNLRSTVAVLGFAVRTLGQMLDEGKLEELVAQQRAQGNRGGGSRRDDDRGGRREGRGEGGRGSRPDPFARPAKPQPPAPEPEPEEVAETAAVAEADSTPEQPADDEGANQDSTAEA